MKILSVLLVIVLAGCTTHNNRFPPPVPVDFQDVDTRALCKKTEVLVCDHRHKLCSCQTQMFFQR